ncbi:unnamed protein product [Toxocara canis]|nr:unnamed protein product [Toxocara canis]
MRTAEEVVENAEENSLLDEAIAFESAQVKRLEEKLSALKEEFHRLEHITANMKNVAESPKNMLEAVRIMEKQISLQNDLLRKLEEERSVTETVNASEGIVERSNCVAMLTSHLEALRIERRAKNIVALHLRNFS